MNTSSAVPVVGVKTAARRLSFGEELLWQGERKGTSAAAFLDCPPVLAIALHLRGDLDVGALSRSLDAIVTRHDVLRSAFRDADAGPLCSVAAQGRRLPIVDLSDPLVVDPVATAVAMLEAELRQGFRADEPPLFRPRLYTARGESVLGFLVHHIVFDGWSQRVLARDLEALYAGEQAGEPAELEPLPVGYHDYVRWQHQAPPAARRRQLEEFWERQLLGAPALDLTDRRNHAESTTADALVFRIGAADTTQLRSIARQRKVTMAMATLALWASAIQELVGSDDIVLGVPTSDRRRLEFESVIGLFANMLVLRLRLGEARDFHGALVVVREQMRQVIAHQDLHYAHVVRDDHRTRGLCRVLFNFIPAVPGTEFRLRGVDVTEVHVEPHAHAIADLTFQVSDHRSELIGTMVYRRESFTPARIETLAACFRNRLRCELERAAASRTA